MKNIFLKTSKIFVLAVVSFNFSGCSSTIQPEPYIEQLQLQSKISLGTEQKILNQIVAESIHNFKVENGCVLLQTNWHYRTHNTYKNCFKITQNHIIKREDKSTCFKNGTLTTCDYTNKQGKKYVASLNNLQTTLKQKLKENIQGYEKIAPIYDKELKKFNQKFAKTKIIIIDETKALPSNTLKQLQERAHTKKYIVYDKHDFIYKFYILPLEKIKENIPYNFKIKTSPTKNSFGYNEKIGNWTVTYDKQNEILNYTDTPNTIKYHITRTLFRYFPKSFLADDQNIHVQVDNGIKKVWSRYGNINNETILSFTISNKTDEFLRINKIAGYYNGEIVNLLPTPIELPPHSYKDIKHNLIKENFPQRIVFKTLRGKNIPPYKNMPDSSITDIDKFYKQSVDYGFSIAYSIDDSNVRKTLYRVKNYTIKDILESKK